MAIIRAGLHANTLRTFSASAMERMSNVLAVAQKHVPHLVTNGARVNMTKWRVELRGKIADLASRGQSLDEEIMRNYFPDLVQQGVCIHGNWPAAVKDFQKHSKVKAVTPVMLDLGDEIEFPIIESTPQTTGSKSKIDKIDRVREDILLLASMRQDLWLGYMLRTNRLLVRHGIKKYGTWKAAVEGAGLDYSRYGPYSGWELDDFLEKGKELLKQKRLNPVLVFKKEAPTKDPVNRNELNYFTAVYERLGQWDFENWINFKTAVENYKPKSSDENTSEPVESEEGPVA